MIPFALVRSCVFVESYCMYSLTPRVLVGHCGRERAVDVLLESIILVPPYRLLAVVTAYPKNHLAPRHVGPP